MTIIVLTARVPPARDNIGAYSTYLASGLQQEGHRVHLWALYSSALEESDISFTSFARYRTNTSKLVHLVRAARHIRHATVLWQYQPFMYGWKGLPIAMCLVPLALRWHAHCRVVVVLHEIAVERGRDPRSLIWAFWHWLCLWFILQGCDAAVTTNGKRQQLVQRFTARYLPWRAGALRLATLPVGSVIPLPPPRDDYGTPSGVISIGMFYASVPLPKAAFIQGLWERLTKDGHAVRIVLIGADGQDDLGRPFQVEDAQPGVVTTGYVERATLGRVLSQMDIFIVLSQQGASGRHTALTQAFACGISVISTSGPYTDHHLFQHGLNCLLLANNDVDQLIQAIEQLCADPALRARLGRAAFATYQQSLCWPVLIRTFLELLTSKVDAYDRAPVHSAIDIGREGERKR